MSGQPWSHEQKAAHAERMRLHWADPAYREWLTAKSQARSTTPEARAAASERMRKLNERMSADPALKRKCIAGQKRVRRSKSYRQMQSLVMTETMARPENREKARQHACKINRDAAVRKRQWDGRRRKQLKPPPKPKASAPPSVPAAPTDANALFLKLLAGEVRQ
ncbi:hypothetical protein [Bradyrhizobium liaoningense]|uniref:hypothetical protein n=1 Tax=Bradyrhizobium liaoningense TaxID=43992 RepID=UPI001BA46882|nr:hypothetical protein [Bradyrhizobium liaoningense]MBR0855518.1 hypothetical protein [Bradyrhizobium liaoningense]